MKYKITIEEVIVEETASSYPKTTKIFEQVIETENENIVGDIIKATNEFTEK